jgi:hypothetical protein
MQKCQELREKKSQFTKTPHDLSNVPKPGGTVACSWEREVPPPPPPPPPPPQQQTCMNEF